MMTSIRIRLATASAALAAVLQATMPAPRGGERPRIYAVRIAAAEPRTPVYLTRFWPRRKTSSLW